VEVVNRLTCMSRKKAIGGWYDTAVTQHDSDCTSRVAPADDDDGDGDGDGG
jgi:hypothetical protein